jgi:hypothetical protein
VNVEVVLGLLRGKHVFDHKASGRGDLRGHLSVLPLPGIDSELCPTTHGRIL